MSESLVRTHCLLLSRIGIMTNLSDYATNQAQSRKRDRLTSAENRTDRKRGRQRFGWRNFSKAVASQLSAPDSQDSVAHVLWSKAIEQSRPETTEYGHSSAKLTLREHGIHRLAFEMHPKFCGL